MILDWILDWEKMTIKGSIRTIGEILIWTLDNHISMINFLVLIIVHKLLYMIIILFFSKYTIKQCGKC